MKYSVNDLIMLNMIPGFGYVRFKALLDKFGTTEGIFNATEAQLCEVPGIKSVIAKRIIEAPKTINLDKEMDLIGKHSVKVVTIFDEDYPKNLKEIYDPPIVLYVKGEIAPLDEAAVAIVGTRRATYYGNSSADRLARELASRGITVVSGMARGIDTSAHRGALRAKGRTIAVLGSGLARIYPPENKGLSDEIAQSGAVVSEFPMETGPQKFNFPARNRTISGLSLGIVVVEAPKQSGALITARLAMEQNREVFSVPGEAGRPCAQGTNQLIRDGAKLVESADDVIEELKPRLEHFLKENKSDSFSADSRKFTDAENRILSVLSNEPLHIDEVSGILSLRVSEVSSMLLKLMLSGCVKELPGKNFVRN